jgi:hypothetical protein
MLMLEDLIDQQESVHPLLRYVPFDIALRNDYPLSLTAPPWPI